MEYEITIPEVEKHVLGIMLTFPDMAAGMMERLTADCFYDNKHRLIFEAMCAQEEQSEPCSVIGVMMRLREQGKLEEAGNVLYLQALSNDCASSAYTDYYVALLVNECHRRRLYQLGVQLSEDAKSPFKPNDEMIAQTEEALLDIGLRNHATDMVQARQVLQEVAREVEQRRNGGQQLSGVASGFRQLDSLTGGWQPSDLIVIAARPGQGKTAFAISMMMQTEVPVGFFSLEMSRQQVGYRMLSQLSGIPSDKLRRGRWVEDTLFEKEMADYASDAVLGRIYVDDTPSLTLSALRLKAQTLVREHNVKMLVVDYLQLMRATGMSRTATREQEVSSISRGLKALAKQLQIPIVALAQLNRRIEQRSAESNRPLLSDLRESGAIEQDADIVCFLHRPSFALFEDCSPVTVDAAAAPVTRGQGIQTSPAQLIIAKHRNGPVGEVNLVWNASLAKYC
ncbi:MAG: replicative DNA helicase [Paludibacteraceae bacterium]|nr:replicative DNA helicase [Paludibacteraceae bacterium]